MKIQVKVKTGARSDRVSFDGENQLYTVSTKVQPIDGKANAAVIKLLAEYFKVPKSQINLKIGQKSKIKIFEIIFRHSESASKELRTDKLRKTQS